VALEKLDLTIGDGEFVAVVGPSGCGKSTMMRLISRLSQASTGQISVFGDVSKDPPRGMSVKSDTSRWLPDLQISLIFDVGANVGALSLAMARSVAPHGRVLAIEPTPRTAKLLRRTCALAGLEQIIQIEECAVGATDGTAMLAMGATCGHNSLLPLDRATISFEWRFEAVSDRRTRLSQRIVLAGDNAASYAPQVQAAFGANLADGMTRIANAMAAAAAAGASTGGAG